MPPRNNNDSVYELAAGVLAETAATNSSVPALSPSSSAWIGASCSKVTPPAIAASTATFMRSWKPLINTTADFSTVVARSTSATKLSTISLPVML